MSKFEVQEYTLCDGWTNNWSHEQDGQYIPTQFDSVEDAESALREFFYDEREALADGLIEDVPDEDQFRIVEV